MRFSKGETPAQTQSGAGLKQRGQSAVCRSGASSGMASV
jgi:hypothetical protein